MFYMGASDWGSTSQLLCLLTEVLSPSIVASGLAMYEQLRMQAAGFIESQLASQLAGSIQAAKQLQEIQQTFADRQTK